MSNWRLGRQRGNLVRGRRNTRPALERLEDRTTPTVLTFNLDAANSSVTASGSVDADMVGLHANLNEQVAGSLKTAISGTIKADYDAVAHTLTFQNSTALAASVFGGGNLQPGVGGAAGSAPADLGGTVSISGFVNDTALLALRGVTGDLASLGLSLGGSANDQTFGSGDVTFSLPAGGVDYSDTASLIGSGTKDLSGMNGVNQLGAPDGHLTDLGGGNFGLSLPINATFITDLGGFASATLNLSGSLVATTGSGSTNHAPSITAPSSVTGTAGAALVLSTANNNAISIADQDGDAQTVTLTATHGTVKLARTTHLTVQNDGTASVTASGSLAAINAALNGLKFTPTAGFKGTATVKVHTDDGKAVADATVKIAVAAPITLKVLGTRVTEGDSGTVDAVFPLRLSAALPGDLKVNFNTIAGTATAGKDFNAIKSGSVTIPAGQKTGEIHVQVIGDTLDEDNEQFQIRIKSVSGGGFHLTGAQPLATATIIDNDPPPTVSIDSVSAAEGSHGAKNFVFHVTLSAPSAKTITINFTTQSGTAKTGKDFTALAGTLTFKPGQTAKTITVKVIGDKLVEADEVFHVKLSKVKNATIATGTGTGNGTITNDD